MPCHKEQKNVLTSIFGFRVQLAFRSMKYLAALRSSVDSIKNLTRLFFAFGVMSSARSQASSRLKGYLHLADQIKQLEETVQELEDQVKLRNRLLSIISHDTRAPLNSIKSMLHLLSRRHLAHSELRTISINMDQEVGHIISFLENLLQWVKHQHAQIEPNKENLLLRPLVTETIELLSPIGLKKRVRIHCQIAENEMIYGDAEMIKTIIRNLIYNAIKFCEAQDSIHVQAYQLADGVAILVRDTGRGISKENLDKLFRISNLSTHGTKDEIGTGIGLTICREFVEKLGGTIHASSEEGQGSSFEFTVPYAHNESQQISASR